MKCFFFLREVSFVKRLVKRLERREKFQRNSLLSFFDFVNRCAIDDVVKKIRRERMIQGVFFIYFIIYIGGWWLIKVQNRTFSKKRSLQKISLRFFLMKFDILYCEYR